MGLLILFTFAAAIIVVIGTLALIYRMQRPVRKTYAVAVARGLATEPAELGLDAEPRTFRFDDGTESPGWVIRGQRESGPTVIVTHGWGDSRYGALTRAPLLAPFASRIVVYDMRGHGDSTARVTRLTAAESDDLIAVMDQTDEGGRFVLHGYSMGAGISLVAAVKDDEQRAAERRDDDPADGASARSSSRVAGVILEAGYRWPMEPIAGYLWCRRVPPYPFVWLAGWHLAFWLGIRNAAFDRVGWAKRVRCPLLLMHGEADVICRVADSRAIAAAADRARFVPFPAASHASLAVADETRYREALATFFDRDVADEAQGR